MNVDVVHCETGILPLPAFSITKVKASCFLANSNSCSSSGSISIGSLNEGVLSTTPIGSVCMLDFSRLFFICANCASSGELKYSWGIVFVLFVERLPLFLWYLSILCACFIVLVSLYLGFKKVFVGYSFAISRLKL